MNREGFQFDLETQRFLTNRWETETGKSVRDLIINGIKDKVDIRSILDHYVLDHPENIDPYRYPYYPKDEIKKDKFWVLTQDDLRGIHFYNLNLSYSPSLEKKSLSYSYFYNCDLTESKIYNSDLSYARFETCKMKEVLIDSSGGYGILFKNCSLNNAYLCNCELIDCSFDNTDLCGAYMERSILKNLKVNHRTKFDQNIRDHWNKEGWKTRYMPKSQKPDILRSIRLAYEKAEIWDYMDVFLYREKVAQRKYILWPKFKEERNWTSLKSWLLSCLYAISGYSTKPFRLIFMGIFLVLSFALIYLCLGGGSDDQSITSAALNSLFYSFSTFTTFGSGSASLSIDTTLIRLLSVLQACIGAIFISFFVVALARKYLR